MEKKKRAKADKKAGAKAGKKGEVSQAERFRRASLVVDVAAMATFETEEVRLTLLVPLATTLFDIPLFTRRSHKIRNFGSHA